MSRDRSQVPTHKYIALLCLPFICLPAHRARDKHDKLLEKSHRSVSHMLDKYNLIVKHLFEKIFFRNVRDGYVAVTSMRGRDLSVFQGHLNHEAVQSVNKRPPVDVSLNSKCKYIVKKREN